MKTPIGFYELCSGLHQDAMVSAEGDLEKLGRNCVDFVGHENRAELLAFLGHVLTTSSPAEVKGLIKREKREIALRRPKAATAFLQAACSALRGGV